MSLDGKRIILTGGATGIGRATAIRVASEGAKVAFFDVNDADAESTLATITNAGGEARGWAPDCEPDMGLRSSGRVHRGGRERLRNPRRRYPHDHGNGDRLGCLAVERLRQHHDRRQTAAIGADSRGGGRCGTHRDGQQEEETKRQDRSSRRLRWTGRWSLSEHRICVARHEQSLGWHRHHE